LRALEFIFNNFAFRKAVACTHGLLIRRLGHHLSPELTEMLPIPNCGVYALHWERGQISFQGLIHDPKI
jgi:probable phosphoglycerate mutase